MWSDLIIESLPLASEENGEVNTETKGVNGGLKQGDSGEKDKKHGQFLRKIWK